MLDINIHKTILLRILKNIYSDSALSSILGFKGGTAAYFFYALGRFSVDLDLDLLDESKEQLVFERIKKIVSEFGVVKEATKKRNTILFVLSYSDQAQNIKVEISRRNFGSRYELKSYLGISMYVMIKEDMFAHKLVAMLERGGKTHRDIFDVWFFLKNNWSVNEGIIKKRTNLGLKQFLEKCVGILEGMSDRNILSGIGELLDQKQKAWVKANLRKDTIFLLKLKGSIA